jgi:hypothetical protein
MRLALATHRRCRGGCGSTYLPRYRPAHVIGRPDKVRTVRIAFDPSEAATAWIAEMRLAQEARAR